ncbi:MAG: nuclear transport factor 2 family protein [Cyanobacteria bacterium P01_E01_bin.42]
MEREIQETIAKAVEACQQKNAAQFAALFTLDAELVLAGGKKIQGRDAIARITADYFRQLEEISIKIAAMNIDGDRAVIQWTWYSRNRAGQQKRRDNTIELSFQGTAIARWQEAIAN